MAPACAFAGHCAIREVPESLPEPLLEPVMRVRFVVERLDLDIPGGSIEADRLDEIAVRLEVDRAHAVLDGERLQLGEQAPAEAEAARRLCDPHPLELGRLVAVELEGATAERLRTERRNEEESGGRAELIGCRGHADGVVEAALEPLGEHGVVLGE